MDSVDAADSAVVLRPDSGRSQSLSQNGDLAKVHAWVEGAHVKFSVVLYSLAVHVHFAFAFRDHVQVVRLIVLRNEYLLRLYHHQFDAYNQVGHERGFLAKHQVLMQSLCEDKLHHLFL